MPPAAVAAAATPAVAPTDHNKVHKLFGSFNELTPRLETEANLALLNTDLREWTNVVRQKLITICMTRANLIKFYIQLTQTTNKALYIAYVAASNAADAKYFSSTTFNDA